MGQAPQVVMTMPLLEGLDGTRKMSKSYGNFVGLTDAPEEMYGKLMSVPDPLMIKYYELLTDQAPAELARIRSGAIHPMEAKKRLASRIVSEYYEAQAAGAAQRYFESKHQRREVPDNAPVFRLERDMWICELMKQIRFAPSTNEARRLIGQGAVRVDGEVVNDVNFRILPGTHKVLEVGKRRVARIQK
jgi:tyrosyl-tRNA synthetase